MLKFILQNYFLRTELTDRLTVIRTILSQRSTVSPCAKGRDGLLAGEVLFGEELVDRP